MFMYKQNNKRQRGTDLKTLSLRLEKTTKALVDTKIDKMVP